MIRAVDDASFIRICKLAAVAACAGGCLACAAFLLHGHLRQITAGAVAGVALAIVSTLIGAYRHRGPPEVGPAAAQKKSRLGQAGVFIAIALANVCLVAVRLLHVEWLAAGFFVGLFGFIALIFSPLFWARPNPRVEPSPRARMTTVERAVSVRYE